MSDAFHYAVRPLILCLSPTFIRSGVQQFQRETAMRELKIKAIRAGSLAQRSRGRHGIPAGSIGKVGRIAFLAKAPIPIVILKDPEHWYCGLRSF